MSEEESLQQSRVQPVLANLLSESHSESTTELAVLVKGCRDDLEGLEAKKHVVRRHCDTEAGADMLDVLCALHHLACLVVPAAQLLSELVTYKKGTLAGAAGAEASAHTGFFLASALASCAVGDMQATTASFLASNPKLDPVAVLAYVNKKGFIAYDEKQLVSVIDWTTPETDSPKNADWRVIWGLHDRIPEGQPWYANIRDSRGRRAKLAFLGSVVDGDPTADELAKVSEVLTKSEWKVPAPAMCITVDAGSMHPRQLDSINRMAHLPQYNEWVLGQAMEASKGAPTQEKASLAKRVLKMSTPVVAVVASTGAAGSKYSAKVTPDGSPQPVPKGERAPVPVPPEPVLAPTFTVPATPAAPAAPMVAPEVPMSVVEPVVAIDEEPASTPPPSPPPSPPIKSGPVPDSLPGGITLATLMRATQAQWRTYLPPVNTDEMLGDGSINNIIFTKVKEVFAALLDAAVLGGSWVIVDRTDGSGSATAELLLEVALERIAKKPVILVIDSLERLGKSREGSRSRKIIKQLHDVFIDEECTTQELNGSEKDFTFDYLYSTEDYESSAKFAKVKDSKLPFAVIAEHQRKAYNNTCDPNRKWRYVYVDGIFSSGTHIVIKNNDSDPFDVEEAGTLGFLYAHGDSRTYKRLRSNIQQGRPIVMLHNSGGPSMAFSWLQRVMASQRPPPEAQELGGPLRFVLSMLSEANWTMEFGVPEMIMMRSLAERAPMLFRQNVVSVDILTNSEEKVLEVVSSCFAQAGGVPELGLGNAEVNTVFTTWMLHLTLYENGRKFHRFSVVFAYINWTLYLLATTVAVCSGSVGSGVIAELVEMTDEQKEEAKYILDLAAIGVPIAAALATTIVSRMKWRDKWSTCIMGADTLASEIYKFRMQTCEYDQSKSPGMDEDGNPLPPLSVKEKARRARSLFVERVQAFYQACLTDLAMTSSLKPTKAALTKRGVVRPYEHNIQRSKREQKPSLAQWVLLKVHCEHHFYRARWAFPLGISFLTWISGLRPYLSQRTMREEMKTTLNELNDSGDIKLVGTTPLRESESRAVRHALATRLGLTKNMFDGVKDEIRVLQRKVVLEIAKEALIKAGKSTEDVVEESVTANSGEGAGTGILSGTPRLLGDIAAKAVPTMISSSKKAAEETVEMASMSGVRDLMMELQGAAKPRDDEGEALKKAKAKTKAKANVPMTQNDDDYLAGPLTVDSYMTYRVRPSIDMLEGKVNKLSVRLAAVDIVIFVVSSSGALFGVFNWLEFVALTVSIAAILQSFIEFVQLRDQVTAMNLALRDLESLGVLWDSLSIVRRRTPGTKMQIVSTTEAALLMVVDAHTTAASNTVTSVHKKLAGFDGEDDGED